MGWIRIAGVAASLALAGLLWGCDRGDAAAPARNHAATASGSSFAPHDRTPTPLLDGKPIWADNRQHSAQENVDYQFDHWGSAFGAKDSRDYARKARAFIEHPPRGVERVTRPNGDVLMYDKATNTFAIERRDGAPRLFRKPPGGAADWAKAKSEAPSGGGRARSRYNAPASGDYRRGEGD